jgi:hypothetical protein
VSGNGVCSNGSLFPPPYKLHPLFLPPIDPFPI